MASTLRSKCLKAIQKLSRISAADEYGMVQCVSCDKRMHWKSCDGGHYIAKGSSSYWALEIENVHPQCKGCNAFGMSKGTVALKYNITVSLKFWTNLLCIIYITIYIFM